MDSFDAGFRRSLAGCLAGIMGLLFAATLQLAGLTMGPPYEAGFGFIGLLIAVAGILAGAVGVIEMERSAGSARPQAAHSIRMR